MNPVLPAVVGLLGLAYPALFALSTVTGSTVWRVKSRTDLLVSALNAALVLLLLHQLFSWWIVPVMLWLVPVAVFAVGVAGAIVVWPRLGWLREKRSAPRTIAGAAVNVAVVGAIAWLVLA